MTVGGAVLDSSERARLHATAITDAAAVVRTAPDAVVPFYPEWRVRDLAVHTVESHLRGCVVLEQGASERPTFELELTSERPAEELAGALVAVGARLRHAVDACAHREVWTFGSDRTPAFWLRRMLLEATLHRWDAESAIGPPGPVDQAVAEDGISEFLDIAVLRRLASSDAALDGRVRFDTGRRVWLLDLGARRVQAADAASDVATVSGTPADVWLWLNRRLPTGAAVTVQDRDGALERMEALISGLRRAAAPRG